MQTTAESQQIPLRLAGGFAPVAAVWIEGAGPFDFLVDTGTDAVLVDGALARRFRWPSDGEVELDSLNGTTRVARYTVSSFCLGGQAISDVEVLGSDLRGVQRLDHRIQGVIGFSLLRRFSFQLDYPARKLSLWRGEIPARGAGTIAPATIDGRILIQAESPDAVAGRLNLVLDSGIAQPLIFTERLRSGRSGGASLVTTNATDTVGFELQLGELQVGDVRWRNVTAVTVAGGGSPQDEVEDGLLPACAFAAVRFERETNRVILIPRAGGLTCSPPTGSR